MKKLLFIIVCLAAASGISYGADVKSAYTLTEIIAFGLRNNPQLSAVARDADLGTYGVASAKAEKLPRVNLGAGMTRHYLPTPVTPITGSPFQGVRFPEFDTQIYDAGVFFSIPLYRGGQLDRAVGIAEIGKAAAEDAFRSSGQELVFNLTSVYFKIMQLEKLLALQEETVRQLEAHKKDVEQFLLAGTVPRLDLMKTETELSHGRLGVLLARNSIGSAYDLLRTLMGLEDGELMISIVPERYSEDPDPDMKKCTAAALSGRPDYLALLKRRQAAEERVGLAEGKRLPSVNLAGEYTERSGAGLDFEENWFVTLRLSFPLFDGGLIRTEVERMKAEAEKARDEERIMRNRIIREVRDSIRNIGNAKERVFISLSSVESARENLRVERLRYEAGTGTSTEVIDAQASFLRAETDHHQAQYDYNIAQASLKKAVGEDAYTEALR